MILNTPKTKAIRAKGSAWHQIQLNLKSFNLVTYLLKPLNGFNDWEDYLEEKLLDRFARGIIKNIPHFLEKV